MMPILASGKRGLTVQLPGGGLMEGRFLGLSFREWVALVFVVGAVFAAMMHMVGR